MWAMPTARLYDGPLHGQTHELDFVGVHVRAVGNSEDRRLVGYTDDGMPLYSYPEHVYKLVSFDDGTGDEIAYRFEKTRPA